ncbi:ATP-binding protein [Dokdonella sp.]|uniref:ATP-binding protein n=1 Tax=Dokdonella sp. TaxID=2291710 RepID=UPI001B2E1ED3|nr:ATP-binding protein [Dokdonella sp.]MBO9662251.1 HAMP domain-containing protein [Dokdonella sp.]
MNTPRAGGRRWWPRTIAARLSLIVFGGLLAAHALSFALLFYERHEAASSMLLTNLEQDVVVAVNLLDHLPANERAQWLPMLRRRTFHYLLGAGRDGAPLASDTAREMSRAIAAALGPRYRTTANAISADPERFQVHLQLGDGSAMTIEVQPSVMPLAKWLPYVLLSQLAVLLLCTWLAVRLATRPLQRLATAARTLNPAGDGERLREGGPSEVADAVAAFNTMQERIAQYTQERLQILASVSHDLQTPITRMQLRAETIDDESVRDKMIDDLGQMQQLVREGIVYARSAHGAAEAPARIDLDALLESLVYDYQDIGRPVRLHGRLGRPVITRPNALRRIVGNLVDNALKYAGAAELHVAAEAGGVRIAVRDRGPGIPDAQLGKVMEPFHRLETSRNRDTGGTGLGLAIAQQLAASIGATLTLRNRDGGGLEASLYFGAAGLAAGARA